MSQVASTSRRSFLVGSGSVAIGVSFGLSGSDLAQAQAQANAGSERPFCSPRRPRTAPKSWRFVPNH